MDWRGFGKSRKKNFVYGLFRIEKDYFINSQFIEEI
jgi:hypothetical protein